MLITLVVTSLITIVLIIVGLAFYLISVLIDDSDDDGGAIIGLGLDSQDFNSTPVASPNDVPRWANNGSRPRQLHYAATTATNTTTMEPESCNCTRAWEEGTAVTIRGKTTVEGSGSMRSGMEADHSFDGLEATNDSSSEPFDNAVSPEDIQSAELNSRLFKVSEQQRELAREEGPDEESALDQLEETTFEGATGAPAEATSGSPASGVAPPQKTGRAPGNKGRTETGAVAWQDEAPVAQKNRIITQLGATIGKQIVDDFDLREVQLGGTGLHWCKTRSSLDKLVKLGVPLELLNRRKETALHVAIRRHKLPVLIGLLVNGANIECRNGHDESPLMVACKVRNIFAVQMLLIFEANYDATDRFGHSARHYTSVICERNKSQNQQVPSAAHLILAMLNEIGAKRCPQKLATASKSLTTTTTRSTLSATNDSSQGSRGSQTSQGKSLPSSLSPPPSTPASITQARQQEHHHSPPTNPQQTGSLFEACCEGCSANGIYNGNSYNRWPNFKRESLYKRHMFDDIIETKLTEALQQRRNRKRNPTTKISRLLCIDGGGLRGVIVCQILIEMEKYLKRPMVSYFDWIGGTSVGAFIACALCIGVPLKELRQICFDVKDEVFAGGRPYNSKHLERVLRRTFGNTTRFSEVKDRHLAVTTVLADREPCQLRLFRNYDSPSRLLERYGYAADTFNNLSGHSIVTEWSKAGNKGSNKANGKQAAKVTVASSNAIPKPESRVSTANQPVDTNRTNSISSNSATAKQPLTTTTTSDGREADNNQAGSVIDEQQSRKTTVKMSSDTDQTCTTHAAANNEMIVRDKSKPDAGGRKESTAAKESTVSANNANQQQEAILEENDPDPIIWKTVRASTAAPFFFKPYGPYLDGGIISNNPTLDMLNEFESYQKVRKFLRKHVKRSDIPDSERSELGSINEATSKLSLVVSLGTGKGRVIGRQTMIDFGQVASGFATVFSPIELVRSIRAARDFFKKLMQQSCHTDDYILDRAQAWCSSLGIPYFRINPPLTTIFSIDDKRDEQLVNALWQTKLYMRAMKDQLNELADILDGTDQI